MEDTKKVMPADMHVHTTYSDGQYTPTEIITLANSLGVEVLSKTDHDLLHQASASTKICVVFTSFRLRGRIWKVWLKQLHGF